MQKTLGLIKPDAIERGIIGEIIAVIESERLKVVDLKMLRLSRVRAEQFYSEHKHKGFFPELIDYMTSGPIVAFVLEGENAVTKYRELMGDTDPKKALVGTIRELFGISRDKNSVHGSDSIASASREIDLVFGVKPVVVVGEV